MQFWVVLLVFTMQMPYLNGSDELYNNADSDDCANSECSGHSSQDGHSSLEEDWGDITDNPHVVECSPAHHENKKRQLEPRTRAPRDFRPLTSRRRMDIPVADNDMNADDYLYHAAERTVEHSLLQKALHTLNTQSRNTFNPSPALPKQPDMRLDEDDLLDAYVESATATVPTTANRWSAYNLKHHLSWTAHRGMLAAAALRQKAIPHARALCICGKSIAVVRCLDCCTTHGGSDLLLCAACDHEHHPSAHFHRREEWSCGYFKAVRSCHSFSPSAFAEYIPDEPCDLDMTASFAHLEETSSVLEEGA